MSDGNEGKHARSELTQVLTKFKREFAAVGAFSAIVNLLMLAPTLYMLQVFDRVMTSQNELTLLVLSLVTVFFFVVMGAADVFRSNVLVRTGVRMDEMLSTRVFNASFEASLKQVQQSPSKSFADLLNVRQFLTGSGINAFFDAPWAPIYIAVLFLLHPLLGVLALVFAGLQATLAWAGHRRAVAPAEQANAALAAEQQYVQGKLRNAEVLHAMGMVESLHKHWQGLHAQMQRVQGMSLIQGQTIAAWSKWLRYTQQSLALAAGAYLVIEGELSAGAMIASNVLMTRALAPIDSMVSSWRSLLSAQAAYRRLEQLLQDFPERDAALRRTAPAGQVSLKHVFAYAPGRNAPILKDVTLQASPGTVTVVLGPSGSGKSTLARVLMGIWPAVQGEVLLDGRPMAGWDRLEIGPYLGYLPQDIELFSSTIAQNIARMQEPESEKVIQAAKDAGLHGSILRFPKGYDTPIGDGGSALSGGQRQRIGLARAIYGNPKLLVLDEPNSNLDDVGEAALLQAVQAMKQKGCTVFLITHRAGAIALADQLLLMKDGQLHLHGPRDEVLLKMKQATLPSESERPALLEVQGDGAGAKN